MVTKKKASFGNVLKKIRKERQMTQKMLSQDICSQSVLSRIENDEELPNVLVMQQLCGRLGVTMDYVMTMHSDEVQKIHQLLQQMADLFYHQEYQELYQMLKDSDFLGQLYIDTDLQMYYYYLGSCEYFLNHRSDLALTYLNQGLSYTVKGEKNYFSSNEIQLISCIGRVLDDSGQTEKGRAYLTRSVTLYQQLPPERVNSYLAKVFFNYARFLYKHGEGEEALVVLKEGVQMVRAQTSYYYLEEMYGLVAEIFAAEGPQEKATRFQAASEAVRVIRQI